MNKKGTYLKERDEGYKRGFGGKGRKEGIAMLYYSISYFLSKKEIKNIVFQLLCPVQTSESTVNTICLLLPWNQCFRLLT